MSLFKGSFTILYGRFMDKVKPKFNMKCIKCMNSKYE